jgi:hypothetical protein
MADEQGSQRGWDSLIQKDPQVRRIRPRSSRVLQDGLDLSACHAGKPFEKLLNGRPTLQVLKQGSDGDARAPERPGPADSVRISLHGVAPSPIKHVQTVPSCTWSDKHTDVITVPTGS